MWFFPPYDQTIYGDSSGSGAKVSFEGDLASVEWSCRDEWPHGFVFGSKATAEAFLARERRLAPGDELEGEFAPKVASAILSREPGATVFVLEIYSDEMFVNGLFASKAEAEVRPWSRVARVASDDPPPPSS